MVCAILVPKYGYLWFKLYAILEICARASYVGNWSAFPQYDNNAFKMVSNRVIQMLGENIDENTTLEPPKKPTNNGCDKLIIKGKSAAFGDACPVMLHTLNEIRTFFSENPDAEF